MRSNRERKESKKKNFVFFFSYFAPPPPKRKQRMMRMKLRALYSVVLLLAVKSVVFKSVVRRGKGKRYAKTVDIESFKVHLFLFFCFYNCYF